MHKKLEAELVSIAHSILQMKNRDDIVALHKKAQELHEKLAILLFIDDYLETTPNVTETREELIAKVEKAATQEPVKVVEKKVVKETAPSIKIDEKVEEVEETLFEIEPAKKVEEEKETKKTITFEEELKGTVSVDVTADLFKKEPVVADTKASLNDRLMQKNIQVGLNDRIAFVKHLFNHSQADFNRVLSQLNTFKTEKEAKNFIDKMVKPDYNWTGKEEYEERLLALVERRFL